MTKIWLNWYWNTREKQSEKVAGRHFKISILTGVFSLHSSIMFHSGTHYLLRGHSAEATTTFSLLKQVGQMLRPKCGSYIFYLPAQIHWVLGFIHRPKLMWKIGWQHLYVIISRKLIPILYIYIYMPSIIFGKIIWIIYYASLKWVKQFILSVRY